MPTDVIMPKVDMVMETGTIVRWYRQEGEAVRAGEPLLEIETDKSTIDVEAPGSGTLAAVSAQPGDTVPVATLIALILAPGEAPPASGGGRQEAGAAKAAQAAPADPVAAATVVARPAETNGAHAGDPRPRATPLARSLARQHGLDLWQVVGSGPQGRVVKEDVLRALKESVAPAPAAVPVPSATPARAPAPASTTPNNGSKPYDDGELVPLTGARRVTAERLAMNTGVPTFVLSVEVVMSAIQGLRERLPYRPSVTAIIARAVAPLLARHPDLNASFRPDGIWRNHAVHLGVAMDVDGRLLVPVIRDAQSRGLREIHASIRELRERAGSRQLGPGELQGSTFSISNLGMLGVDSFTALINPPEAAILAVGRSVERPYRDGAGVAFRPAMTLTLSVDHRVADGAAAARFLSDLRDALEEPGLLL